MSRIAALTAAGLVCVASSPATWCQAAEDADTAHPIREVRETAGGGLGNGLRPPVRAERLTAVSTESERVAADASRPAPHITIENVPPNFSMNWLLNQRVELIVNFTLLALVYLGVMIAIRVLSKIRRRLQETEVIVQAVQESTSSMLARVEAMLSVERSWLATKTESSPQSGNGFSIIACNCGRCPAQITAMADRIGILANESCLPEIPEYTRHGRRELTEPIMLVPGESTILQTFSGGDLEWICGSPESRGRIESGQDHLFVYGRVTYRDMFTGGGSLDHETNWCHEYICDGGRWRLTAAGSVEYNKRT